MIDISKVKKSTLIELDNAPCEVELVDVKSPSARGASTFYKVRARNIITGQKIDKSFRSGDVVKVPDFERRDIQYLYKDENACHFMDLEDYSQFSLNLEMLENQLPYLIEGIEGVTSMIYNEKVVGILLPDTIDLRITECDPAVRGNSATARPKKAVVETGLDLQVPEHIELGEIVKVDTRTGKFLGRVAK